MGCMGCVMWDAVANPRRPCWYRHRRAHRSDPRAPHSRVRPPTPLNITVRLHGYLGLHPRPGDAAIWKHGRVTCLGRATPSNMGCGSSKIVSVAVVDPAPAGPSTVAPHTDGASAAPSTCYNGACLPMNEAARLEHLHSLGILDTVRQRATRRPTRCAFRVGGVTTRCQPTTRWRPPVRLLRTMQRPGLTASPSCAA